MLGECAGEALHLCIRHLSERLPRFCDDLEMGTLTLPTLEKVLTSQDRVVEDNTEIAKSVATFLRRKHADGVLHTMSRDTLNRLCAIIRGQNAPLPTNEALVILHASCVSNSPQICDDVIMVLQASDGTVDTLRSDKNTHLFHALPPDVVLSLSLSP